LFIDINRLHVINDNYGMHMGDRVIAQLGELIRGRLPPGAITARISGDRFAILLPAALPDAAKFAEALRSGAEDVGKVFGDGKMQVSVSIGVVGGRCALERAGARVRCGRNRLQGRQRSRTQPGRGVPGSGREHRASLHRHQSDRGSARRHRG
jgi:diguanylate cyclase (GGDEF)-like protein